MAAYTYRATGTEGSNSDSSPLTPAAPAGKAVGDLLILYTGNRSSGQSIAALTGWSQKGVDNGSNGSIELWLRVADGTSTDTPSPDWTGTNDSYAWIEAWSGDVYTDLATIVQDAVQYQNSSGTVDLVIPSRTVSANDCLLIALCQKGKGPTSNDATTITMPSGLTKRKQLIQSGTAIACASAGTQQTTSANFGGTDATINGTADSSPSHGLIIVLKTQAVVGAPTWTANPAMNSQTASAYTVGFTPSGSCTIYGVAVIAGSAAPTIAQIKAGQNGSGGTAKAAANKAVSGVDTLVLTPSDSPKLPRYDLYFVLNNGSGDSPSRNLVSEFLDAPSGKQFGTFTGVDSTSPFLAAGAVAGDSVVVDLVTTPNSYPVTVWVDGTVSYDSDGATSRQTIAADLYHYATGAYEGAGTLVFNNLAPVGPNPVFSTPLLFRRNVAITTIDLEPVTTDPEGDTITVTALDALPAGLSISSNDLIGTPTAYTEDDTVIQFADQYGSTLLGTLTIQVGDLVPDVDNASTTQAAAIAAIVAVASFTPSISYEFSGSIPDGEVISQSPPSGTLVPYNQVVSIVVSRVLVETASRWLSALNEAAVS